MANPHCNHLNWPFITLLNQNYRICALMDRLLQTLNTQAILHQQSSGLFFSSLSYMRPDSIDTADIQQQDIFVGEWC